jgi:hypothetical protein
MNSQQCPRIESAESAAFEMASNETTKDRWPAMDYISVRNTFTISDTTAQLLAPGDWSCLVEFGSIWSCGSSSAYPLLQ